jgi:hypothetical protein
VYGVNEGMDLTDTLRRLAAAVPPEASPQVQRELSARFRARQRRKARVWIYAAAVLALGLLLVRKHPAAPPSDYVYNAAGFIALPYSQSGVPIESAVVIRVQMRPSELSSMGVAVPAAASTARLKADILVGQDGVARAVRFVE